MKINQTALRRPLAFVAALALAVIGVLPALSFSTVSATSQVSGRSIALSSSTAGATGVTYAMTFTLPDAAQSLVLDICQDSPIIGGACTIPTGFHSNGAAYSTSVTDPLPIPGLAGSSPSGWTGGSTADGTFKVTANSAPNATTAGTKYTFYFTGVTNPTTTGTFYARVYTFANTSYGTYTGPIGSSVGNYVDYGGFALSTANNVTITAIVMETLGFCVSKLAPSASCGTVAGASQQAVTTPALTLGHGTPQAIDTSVIDTDTAYTQLSTNALNGAVVALKTTSSANCSGLSRDNGISCGVPANSAAATAIVAGTAHFGLRVGTASIAPVSTFTGSATVAPTAGTYSATGTDQYYLGATAPISTFGDVIESTPGACQDNNNQLTYAATASATTPAGVYTTTQALIATGTF